MIKPKSELVGYLTKIIHNNLADTVLFQNNLAILETKYGIKPLKAVELLTLKSDLGTESDFFLFCLLDLLKHDRVSSYYTDVEVETYSRVKLTDDSIKFPLKIKAIKVTENQYIGATSAKELCKFRDAQIINYNENTQRTLSAVERGDFVLYKISLNKKSVKEIESLFLSETFVPNTITLNMPSDVSFEYEEPYLVIKELDHFDITDGYHRYIAICNIMNENPDWDYPMEIRITNFQESKSKQFIWQEDQKTKLRKVDSDSMDQTNAANQIVDALNESGSFAGAINRNKGIIDAAVFASVIRYVYFPTKTVKPKRSEVNLLKNTLKTNLEIMADKDPYLLDTPWDYKLIGAFVMCSTDSSDDFYERVISLFEKLKEDSGAILKNRSVTSTDIRRLRKAYNNV